MYKVFHYTSGTGYNKDFKIEYINTGFNKIEILPGQFAWCPKVKKVMTGFFVY